MTEYEKWRVILGIIQIISTLVAPVIVYKIVNSKES